MQAVEIKRHATTRIGIAATGIGVIVALVLGLILLDASEEPAFALPAAPEANRLDQMTLLEDNIARPVSAGRPTRSLAQMQLLGANVDFQSQVSSRSYLDIQWMETNAPLPVKTGSAVRTHANMQVEE